MEWLIKPKQKAKLQGNYNFHLVVSNDNVDSSSTVSITAFSDRTQRAAMPCNYVWFVIKNGMPQEVMDFRGSSFICETSHIGYYLQAHVISNDPEFGGKAIVTLGPVELDVTLKTEILGALSQGYSNQAVWLIGEQSEEKQCAIQVLEDKIRIRHAFSDLSYQFDYSLVQPLLTHHPKQINHLTINFSEKYEQDLRRFERKLFGRQEHSVTRSTIRQGSNSSTMGAGKLQIRFLSRAQRDIFLYTVKGFIARRQIKNSAVVRKIEKINFESDEQFGAILQINELRRDLARYDRAYKKLAGDRRRLEQNLEASTHTTGSLGERVNVVSPRRGEDSARAAQLQQQNESLNSRIRGLVQQVAQLKQMASVPAQPKLNFARKRQPQENTLTHLLDDLSRTEQVVHFDAQNQFMIERLQTEKRHLQMNLDQANERVAFLEKTARSIPLGSISIDKGLFDRMRGENQDLKRNNERLERDLRAAREATVQLRSQQTRRAQSRVSDSQHVQRQLQQVRSQLAISEKQLQMQVRQRQTFEDKCVSLTRRVGEVESEMDMYRRNQDVLNRSQSISEQMEDYNEEQIKILKEHNGFLVAENEKLAKACEKYMTEAKGAIKLRQEILQLREKLNAVYTNPENQSFT